jgi:23S rRNA pseudouridine1911/1915/1917 synthase
MAASVPAALGGMRLDLALARLFPQYSRNRLQAWLKSGHITVDGISGLGAADGDAGRGFAVSPG